MVTSIYQWRMAGLIVVLRFNVHTMVEVSLELNINNAERIETQIFYSYAMSSTSVCLTLSISDLLRI